MAKRLPHYRRVKEISPALAKQLADYYDRAEAIKNQRLLARLFISPRKEPARWQAHVKRMAAQEEALQGLSGKIQDVLYPGWKITAQIRADIRRHDRQKGRT